MDWTPEVVEKLKDLWAQGLSITQIGIRLGITRNAVVGKAHRIGLSRRASVVARTAVHAAATSGFACKWPIGDPKSLDFHFCGGSALLGRPYCATHCAEAYATWESGVKAAGQKVGTAA
jgi:GcrA cell cycle regulator